MSIKQYIKNKNLSYKYSKRGVYKLQLTNNISSATFSGESINGIRSQLVSVTKLDDKFTGLGDYAFADCSQLSGIAMNSTLRTIGKCCFQNCVNMHEIALPASVEKISDYAFAGCRNAHTVGVAHFEDDRQDTNSVYKLASVGNCLICDTPRLPHVVLPDSVKEISKIGTQFLSGSSVSSITFLGLTQSDIMKSTASKCFGVGHNCIVYSSDGKMASYSAASNQFTNDTSYSVYRGTKVCAGKKDKMTLGRKIYIFTEELFKWCTVPSTQDPTKFAQRKCPVITIFCDLMTSAKSQAFADNVLKQQKLYQWMKENLKCYVFLVNRNGQTSASKSSADLQYYRTFFNALGADRDFVGLSFYYDGKFSHAILSEFTLPEFEDAVTKGCADAGFDRFNSDGYAKIGDEPEPETPPAKTVDRSEIAKFHADKFDWYPNDSGAAAAAIWDIAATPMDFGLVATPDTTYVLFCTYDMKLASDPAEIGTKLFPIFSAFSDHAFYYDRCSSSKKKFLPGIAEGIKYRYFIFFEFSHGSSGSITVDGKVTKTELWNALAPAKNRIFGMFDSCHSGSMFKAGAVEDEKEDDFDMAEYLVEKFNRRKLLMSRLFGASTAEIDPYMLMWSSTKANTYGWYNPPTSTVFQRAICKAYGEMPHSRFSEIFPYVQKYGDRRDTEHNDYSTPQQQTYNVDFTGNKVFI